MQILICAGIYPPDIGGPAQYAKNLLEEFKRQGHTALVSTYNLEKRLPTGLRHFYFLVKTLPRFLKSDFIIALDTFSVGLPAVILGKLLGKKVLIRIGGDFLWEIYTERGGTLGLKAFYQLKPRLSFKERIIYCSLKFILKNSYAIFTTNWQKEIFQKVYSLNNSKVFVIENYYGEKIGGLEPREKNFVFAGRLIKLKNLELLKKSFAEAQKINPDIKLEILSNLSHEELMRRLKDCYAVVLPSLSEVSPNFILDAIRVNKPFIMTQETGLYDKLKDIGLFVDLLNDNDLKNKILFLADNKNYENYKNKVAGFNFTHSWSEIIQEFIDIYKKS